MKMGKLHNGPWQKINVNQWSHEAGVKHKTQIFEKSMSSIGWTCLKNLEAAPGPVGYLPASFSNTSRKVTGWSSRPHPWQAAAISKWKLASSFHTIIHLLWTQHYSNGQLLRTPFYKTKSNMKGMFSWWSSKMFQGFGFSWGEGSHAQIRAF